MNTSYQLPLSRRGFLGATTGFVSGTLCASPAVAEDLGRSPGPRATSGDLVEPKWQEHLTITVGPNKGDLAGTTDRVLQAAVDYVAQLGGGTVQILPGTYRLRNAVYLRSNVRLRGSGVDSILMKEPSATTKLAADSDWYDQEITLNDPEGFRIGDGVCLRARNPDNAGNVVLKRTLVARSGNRFKLDKALRENLWQMGESTASTLFPILSGEGISGVAIENLALDGNKPNNANLDGNYAGCIFLQDCRTITIRKVSARNFNGDGISWQICHDVIVEECHSHDNTGLGLHPGSGSQRPIIRDNRLERNDLGLFFCWGVKQGVAEKNYIADNRSYGISIGHRDTDNLIRDNDVLRSGKVGILFRPERGKAFAPHRNRVENNRIADSGPEKGVGIDVRGQVDSIHLSKNTLRETRGPAERIGIRIGAETRDVKLDDNHIEGFATPVADLHKR
jgi:hypothetical protein